MILRDYQQSAVDEIRRYYRQKHRAVLLQSPTGSGKTAIFCHITQGAAAKNNAVWILVHRQELIRQTSAQLRNLNIPHGIIAPKYPQTADMVQVASVQTLARRLDSLPSPALIIVDEAHHAIPSTQWGRILNAYPDAKILGVTATPQRLSGEGLGRQSGGFFDVMINGLQVKQLQNMGFLSPYKYYAPPVSADLSSLKQRMGDFIGAEIDELMNKATIHGDVIKHYRQYADGLPAIAFCASVQHAEATAEAFCAAGYRAASVDGTLDSDSRADRIAALADGRLHVLTSCQVISEGTDIPVVSAAILLRPTASLSMFLQMVGRVLRPAEGKTHAVILDHVGNCQRHGLPDEDRIWTLDGKKKREKTDDIDIKIMQCSRCFYVYTPQPSCPACGHAEPIKQREIKLSAGELKEITEINRRRARDEEKACRTLPELAELARERGYKPGWARMRFNARNFR